MRTYQINPAGVTDIGNVRAVNEDSLLTEGDLFVVADGMGGLGRGEVASRVAVQSLRQAFLADPTSSGLVEAVRQANEAVRQQSEADGPDRSMGTTIAAVAMVVEDGREQLAIVNVGDSRVYLFTAGSLTRLSSDHSLVADLVRAGAITEEQAIDHPERHVLTSALGIEANIEPHVASAEPVSGDRLLLCSDGLFNELSGEEIASILATVADPGQAAQQLVGAANEHGGNDNITAVVLDIE